jgi:CRISPR-associated protein Csb2
MLALCLEYLSGSYYAADYRDRQRPEWPPHPNRLFSALMAASYEADLGAAGLDVLRWLETLGPPQIAASDAAERTAPTVFVPVNDAQQPDALPAHRPQQPRHFPCVIPDDPRVYYIWPTATATPVQQAALDRLAHQVTYVGSSRSFAQVSRCAQPPAATWLPAEQGEAVLRVPAPGRVDELNMMFDLGLRPTPGRLQPYTRAVRLPPRPPPRSEFGDMVVLRQVQGPTLALPTTLTLTEALRKTVLSLAGDAAPAALHGHGQAAHVAWLALPFVGHRYADGHLLGAALVFPRNLAAADRLAILASVARMERIRLPDGRAWRCTAPGYDARVTLQPATWTRPSRTWSTVTPLVLPRYPKPHQGLDAAALIRQACAHIGLPPPQAVSLHRQGRLAGVPPSRAFRVHRAGQPKRPYTHATLEFADPVQGPVLLGAARYFGLGLCRPMADAALPEGEDAP